MTADAPSRKPVSLKRSVASTRAIVVSVAGGIFAVLAGAAAAADPVILAVVVVPVVVLVPVVSVALAILADGVSLPILLAGSTATLLNIAVLAAILAAIPAVVARKTANIRVVRVVSVTVLLALPALVIAVFTLPSSQTLSGIRYFIVPIGVALVASALGDRALRATLRTITVLMILSCVAATIETSLGSDALLKLTNLGYGVSIRNIGSVLRAPGTFATNFHLGAFASVFAMISLLWWGTLENAGKDRIWRLLALISSLGCLALSTYRTGVILLAVSVIAAVFLSGSAVSRMVKVFVSVVGAAVVIAFFSLGLGNSDSLFQRVAIWSQLLSGPPALLGRGVGFSGAASEAVGSADPIFTDNYYISLWLQFGIPGLLIIALFIGILGALVSAGRRGNRRAAVAASLWCGALVAFAFVEFWEYTSAMSLIALVVASSASGFRQRLPASAGVSAQERALFSTASGRSL